MSFYFIFKVNLVAMCKLFALIILLHVAIFVSGSSSSSSSLSEDPLFGDGDTNSTATPFPLPTNATNITAIGKSTALFGACEWTSSTTICSVTIIPITLLTMVLVSLLVYNCYITPLTSELNSYINISESPLIPEAFRGDSQQAIERSIGAAGDLPLKTFLPRLELDYLLEPCAVMGMAAVRDVLRANKLALRDIGMGPKEQRIFARGLERRIKLREKFQSAVKLASGQAKRGISMAMKQGKREE